METGGLHGLRDLVRELEPDSDGLEGGGGQREGLAAEQILAAHAAALVAGDRGRHLQAALHELEVARGPLAVAAAIEEHYLPRQQGDATPSSPLGLALCIADRLDNLVHALGELEHEAT
ncbi:MAG: glycine--tRNA ligase subunit beta, partial [Myxococcota bacterium]